MRVFKISNRANKALPSGIKKGNFYTVAQRGAVYALSKSLYAFKYNNFHKRHGSSSTGRQDTNFELVRQLCIL